MFENIEILQAELQHYASLYSASNAWLGLIIELYKPETKKQLIRYLHDKRHEKICIYGAGVIGKALYDAIVDSFHNIVVADKSGSSIYDFKGESIVTTESLPQYNIDCFIVTPARFYNEIEKSLTKMGFKNIYSLAAIFAYMRLKDGGF